MAFGDVDLSSAGDRSAFSTQSAGAGGWPTIRYYNKETGPDGAPYKKVTDKAMCEELKGVGPDSNMRAYVTGYANTDTCTVGDESGKGCSEKHTKYISKWSSKDGATITKEMGKLERKLRNKMKPSLKQWISARKHLLSQMQAQAQGKAEL